MPARLPAALAATAGALLALTGGPRPADGSTGTLLRNLPLRLSDLGPGYRLGDRGCGPLGSEGASPALANVIRRRAPQVCSIEFQRAWFDRRRTNAPGAPVLVRSAAFALDGAEGASELLAVAPDVLRHLVGDDAQVAPAPFSLGNEALTLEVANAWVGGRTGGRGAAVAWRIGNVVGLVYAESRAPATIVGAARALAERQQRHLDRPSAIAPRDNDDSEVALDDPSLSVPVAWLGRRFDPPGRLPPLRLRASLAAGPGGGPGNVVQLDYDGPRYAHTMLTLWEPARWRSFRTTELGERVWRSPCTERHSVRTRLGRAVVYGGYGQRPTGKCPRRAPDRWLAHVIGARVVVAVDIPLCLHPTCVPRPHPSLDAYNSRAGMEAIVRSLRIRVRR